MELGFDLSAIGKQLLGTVPLWFIVWAIFRNWIASSKASEKKIEEKFLSLSEGMAGVQEKLNRIEMNLASQGIDHLKFDLENLKKESVKNEMKIEALFRISDAASKRASDR